MEWLLALLLTAESNRLNLRAFPRVSIAPLQTGCSEVLFTAEILGPETEAWYCPAVEWSWPDGTTSVTESDCAPFEERDACWPPQAPDCGNRGWHRDAEGRIVDDVKECACTVLGFPRRWSRRVCVPAREDDKPWSIRVTLRRPGWSSTQAVDVWVK